MTTLATVTEDIPNRRRIRHNAHYSQAGIGRLARVTSAAVAQWEAGLLTSAKSRVARERLEATYQWLALVPV